MQRDLPGLEDQHRDPDYVARTHLFDRPRNVRILLGLFGLGCVVLFLGDLFVHRHGSFEHSEAEFAPEDWLGFYGLYGFVACVLLVLAATQLRRLLMRGEHYYDPPPEEEHGGDGDAH